MSTPIGHDMTPLTRITEQEEAQREALERIGTLREEKGDRELVEGWCTPERRCGKSSCPICSAIKINEQPQELQRFNRKWKQAGNGCWIWIDRKEGYGAFILNGRKEQAHRVSWLLHRGEIPEGLCVLHDCDTPNCVNPNHLHLGTVKDNAIEAVDRGLWGDKAGESNGNSRLTADQVREIRESPESYRAIAIRFGIGKSQVGNIKKGLQWTKL